MSFHTISKPDQKQNPFSTPEKQAPSDYGSVEEYVQNVTPEEFGFHCIQQAIAVARHSFLVVNSLVPIVAHDQARMFGLF